MIHLWRNLISSSFTQLKLESAPNNVLLTRFKNTIFCPNHESLLSALRDNQDLCTLKTSTRSQSSICEKFQILTDKYLLSTLITFESWSRRKSRSFKEKSSRCPSRKLRKTGKNYFLRQSEKNWIWSRNLKACPRELLKFQTLKQSSLWAVRRQRRMTIPLLEDKWSGLGAAKKDRLIQKRIKHWSETRRSWNKCMK